MAAILWMTDRWSSTNSAVIFSILPFCILICFCHCNHHSFPSKKCQSCGNHHKLTQSVFYNTSPPFDFAAFSAASFTGGFAAASFCLSFRSFNTDPFSSDFSSISVFFSCCLGKAALAGMMSKHVVSLYDMCYSTLLHFDMEQWDEKITDCINYLILLKALVKEEQAYGSH